MILIERSRKEKLIRDVCFALIMLVNVGVTAAYLQTKSDWVLLGLAVAMIDTMLWGWWSLFRQCPHVPFRRLVGCVVGGLLIALALTLTILQIPSPMTVWADLAALVVVPLSLAIHLTGVMVWMMAGDDVYIVELE